MRVPLIATVALSVAIALTGQGIAARRWQALVLDTLLTDVVLGEAKVNIEGTSAHPVGNPCQA